MVEKAKYQAPGGGGFPAEFSRRDAWVFDEGMGEWCVADGSAKGVPGGSARGVHDGSAKGVPDGSAKGVPDGSAKGVPDGSAKGVPDGSAKGVPDGNGSDSIRASRLRLLSYNVLRTDDHRLGLEHDLRIPELIREMDALDADVILLQEVQAPFWKMLLRMPWVRKHYYLSRGPELSHEKMMDEVILSKWAPHQVHSLRFSQAKEATGMRFVINGRPFSIFTLHLPSDMARKSEDKRYRYVKELSHALPEGETVLIGGDFNFEEELPLPESYRDLWELLEGEEATSGGPNGATTGVQGAAPARPPGTTFAPSQNPLAKITSNGNSIDRRLDRIFLYDPSYRLLPHSIRLVGTEPRIRHEETIYLSDHYGLLVEIDLETTVSTLQNATTTPQSAVVYIPPPSTWAEIQAIRRQYDDSFDHWMPHIKLLHGFLPERYFRAAATMIRQAMREEPFFQMELNAFDQFHHGSKQTIWLKPDPASEARWKDIQAILSELFPNCIDQNGQGDFTPHLPVGNVSGRNAGRASRLRAEWSDSWEGLTADVGVLALISRPENGPFVVREVIPLGDESRWESFDPASWDLHTSLGALGLLPGRHHHAAAQHAQEYLFKIVRKIDPKAQLYSVGSFGLGVTGPESDFDFLCIGRVERDQFLRLAADELGGLDHLRHHETDLVPVLKGEFDGHRIDLMYVAYPAEVPISRPSHLPTEGFRHFEISAQMTLSASLEVAALRRFIGPDHGAFQTAIIALKAWARVHQIDHHAFGYPSSLGWTLILAATPAEEAPELWLQRCFEMLVAHDWRLPLMPIDGFYPEDDAAMQVVTASSPARNVTRSVTPGTLKVILAAVESGLDAIWNIRQEGGRWIDFFGANQNLSAVSRGKIEIEISGRDRRGLELVQAWVQRNFKNLLPGIEKVAGEVRPWTAFISDGGFAGRYQIDLGSVPDPEALRTILNHWVQKYEGWGDRPVGGSLNCISPSISI